MLSQLDKYSALNFSFISRYFNISANSANENRHHKIRCMLCYKAYCIQSYQDITQLVP